MFRLVCGHFREMIDRAFTQQPTLVVIEEEEEEVVEEEVEKQEQVVKQEQNKINYEKEYDFVFEEEGDGQEEQEQQEEQHEKQQEEQQLPNARLFMRLNAHLSPSENDTFANSMQLPLGVLEADEIVFDDSETSSTSFLCAAGACRLFQPHLSGLQKLIACYKRNGHRGVLDAIDGEYAVVICDFRHNKTPQIITMRSFFGPGSLLYGIHHANTNQFVISDSAPTLLPYGTLPAPLSAFAFRRSIQPVQPGMVVVYLKDTFTGWWKEYERKRRAVVPFPPTLGSPSLTLPKLEALYRHLATAVSKRTRRFQEAPGRIGCLLSGGSGSTAILALLSNRFDNIYTFTVHLVPTSKKETQTQETKGTAAMATFYHTIHVDIAVTLDTVLKRLRSVIARMATYDIDKILLGVLHDIVWTHDECCVDTMFSGFGGSPLFGPKDCILDDALAHAEWQRQSLERCAQTRLLSSPSSPSSSSTPSLETPFGDTALQAYLFQTWNANTRYEAHRRCPDKYLLHKSLDACRVLQREEIDFLPESFSSCRSTFLHDARVALVSYCASLRSLPSTLPGLAFQNPHPSPHEVYLRLLFESCYPGQKELGEH